MFLLRTYFILTGLAAACAAQCTVTFQQTALNAPAGGKGATLTYNVSSPACYGTPVTSAVPWITFAQEGTGIGQTTTLNSSGVLRYYVAPNNTTFNRISSFLSNGTVVTMAQAPGTTADPAVVSVTAPQYAATGKPIEAIATVANRGTLGTFNFEVRFYWSTDATITSTDTNAGASCTTTLGTWGEYRCIQQLTPPAAGNWYLGALITDPTDTNTANNAAATALPVNVAAPCATVDTTPLNIGANGLSNTLTVNAPPGCNWSASFSQPAGVQQMISVFPQTGSGPGQITWTVYPNFRNIGRTGSLNIGGNIVPVNQGEDPNATSARYIRLLYFSFLGRLPSDAELAFQTANVQTPAQRAVFAQSLLNAPEFNAGGRFAAGLYVGLLNRDAEFSGWLFQRNAYITGRVTGEQLVSNFLSSPEYSLRFGNPDNAGYVRLLYRYVLLREATNDEVAFQAGALANGGTNRVTMAVNFLNSQEFRIGTGPRLTAFLLTAGLFGRDPLGGERQRLLDQLGAGFSTQDLISFILATPEFTGQVE